MFCLCNTGISLGWSIFIIIILTVSLLIAIFLIPDDKNLNEHPLDIAKKRLARGDITQGQFGAIKDKLL